MRKPEPWYRTVRPSVDSFIFGMLRLGTPVELSLVGVFDTKGRGSRRDVELDWHRDGDYSKDKAADIDFVGLYCMRSSPGCVTLIEDREEIHEMTLRAGDALVFDNRLVRHARRGPVGERLLIRMWIKDAGE